MKRGVLILALSIVLLSAYAVNAAPQFKSDSPLITGLQTQLAEEKIFLEKLLQLPLRDNVTIAVFEDQQEYYTYLEQHLNPDGRHGYYLDERKEIVLFAATRSRALEIVTHEYVHYSLDTAFAAQAPVWFEEGLATVVEYSNLTTPLQTSSLYLAYLRDEIQKGTLLSIPEILLSERTDTIAYAHYWGLSYFLISEHPFIFEDLLSALENDQHLNDIILKNKLDLKWEAFLTDLLTVPETSTAPTSEVNCSDSDPENDPSQKGMLLILVNGFPKINVSDYCSSQGVVEWRCNTELGYQFQEAACDNRSYCQEGRCIAIPPLEEFSEPSPLPLLYILLPLIIILFIIAGLYMLKQSRH